MYFKLIHLHYTHTHFLFKLKFVFHRGKPTYNMVSSVGRINASWWKGLKEDSPSFLENMVHSRSLNQYKRLHPSFLVPAPIFFLLYCYPLSLPP